MTPRSDMHTPEPIPSGERSSTLNHALRPALPICIREAITTQANRTFRQHRRRTAAASPLQAAVRPTSPAAPQ